MDLDWIGLLDQVFLGVQGLVAYLPAVLLEHWFAFHHSQMCLGQRGDDMFVIIMIVVNIMSINLYTSCYNVIIVFDIYFVIRIPCHGARTYEAPLYT